MKGPLLLVLALMMFLMLNLAYAQESAQPAPSQPAVVGAPAVVEAPSPIQAPPAWLVDALKIVASLPMIGPYVALALQWFGVLATILTSLMIFLGSSIVLLKSVSAWAGFDKTLMALESFQKSGLMQWLRWSSNFAGPKK